MPEMPVLKEIANKLNVKDVRRIAGWFSRKRTSDHVPDTPIISSREQKEYLKSIYAKTQYPRRRKLNEIAVKFGTTTNQIYDWFLAERIKNNSKRQYKRTSPKSPQGRADLNASATELLEAAFAENPLPTSKKLKEIQEKTDINERRLDIWFDRKRRSIKGLIVMEKLKVERQYQSALKEEYQKKKYLTLKEIDALGDRIGISQTRARRWFQSYRAQDKDFNKDNLINHKRCIIEADKLSVLNEAYQENKYLTLQEIHALADRVGLPRNRVQNWFRYKRTKDKDYESRVRFNANQIQLLQAAYQINPMPSCEEREKLAMEVGLSLPQVTNWYRYAKNKSDSSTEVASLTTKQRDLLLGAYGEDEYPQAEKLAELANRVGLTELQVRNWYQHWAKSKTNKLRAADLLEVEQEEFDLQDTKVKIKMEPLDDVK